MSSALEQEIDDLADKIATDIKRFLRRQPVVVLGRLEEKVNALLKHVGHIEAMEEMEIQQMAEIDDKVDELVSAVSEETDAVTAVGKTIDGLLAQIATGASSGSMQKVNAAIAAVRAQKDALVAAALKGTPADPAPVDESGGEPEVEDQSGVGDGQQS